MKTDPAKPKRSVRYFVSYAHDDDKLPEKLLTELAKHFGSCKHFVFQRWQDTHILPGEKWHDEIQQAIRDCDFGLLLVSPAFFASDYIGEHELPAFVNGEKLCIPVGLCRIDFANHETKGLEESQIFLHATPKGKSRKSFAECTGKNIAEFTITLFGKITARLNKNFSSPPAAPPRPVAAPAKTTNNLPRLHSFFGRQKELDIIAKALLPTIRTWGVLIDGPGGMGKTSLAIRAAEIAMPQFERVLFVSTKEQKLTPDGAVKISNSIVPAYLEMLNQLASLLGISHIADKPETERPGLIKAALYPEKVLLILDNLENLPKDQQKQLFEFLSDLPPGCKAIITSRRRTDVDARIIRLEKLEQDAALEFLEELSADRPLLQKASHEERLYLYEETGGNPLLLRWVVGQLGRGSCRSIASALDLCRKAGASNDPLEFIFGDLLETFTEAETKVLAALTYFTQKIAVKFIAELADLSEIAAQTALGDLANRALVMPDETEENFVLVPMVAEFLRSKRPEVVTETGDRLEKSAYALIVENGYDNSDRYPMIDNAWPTVASALPIFLTGPNKQLQTVCHALFNFLNSTGRWNECLFLCQQAEQKAEAVCDYYNAGWHAYHAGMMYRRHRQIDNVLGCANRAESHWHKAKADARERAYAIRLKGTWHRLVGDYSAAFKAFNTAIDLFRTMSPESGDVAVTLNSRAKTELLSGDLNTAEESFREALRMVRVVGEAEDIAYITGNLVDVALARRDWLGAEHMAREALALSKNTRQELFAHDCRRLAKALMRQGKVAEALPYTRCAVEIYTRLDHPYLADAQVTLAECEAALAQKSSEPPSS